MSDSTPEPFRASATDAYERVQTRVGAHAQDQRFPWRPVGAVFLLCLGLAATWWLLRPAGADGSDNLLLHLAEAADTFQPDVTTTRPGDAEEYVYTELGWAVPPPDLPGLAIVGVGLATVGEAPSGSSNASPQPVVLPTFRYEGASGESAHVFVYDYITLDRVRQAFDLPEATYAVLSEPMPVDTRLLGDTYLVTWRVRAMIFTAVTGSEAAFERVAQAASSYPTGP